MGIQVNPNRIKDPLQALINAVKALPLAKRIDPQWGTFLSQCLLAINNTDNEALAALVNGYQTTDSDYIAILNQAKQLFGL